jgi:predicted ATPase
LLEEPELSLNPGVVRYLPQLMARLVRKSGRQLFVSTHSAEILSDRGIGGENIILLTPTKDGTKADVAARLPEIRALLESGLPASEAVLPRAQPRRADQLALFDG